jgi:hypothetical protein
VFPLPPIVAAALAGLAALLATYLPRPAWLSRVIDGVAAATPLGWYLVGVVLGPALGLLDDNTLDAAVPAMACAIGWVAALAGATLAAPRPAGEPRAPGQWAVAALTLAIPAALLYGASRFPPPALAPAWKPAPAIIATLVAALLVAAATDVRTTTAALLAAAAALITLLPRAHAADLLHAARWVGFAIGGAATSALVAGRLARRAPTPVPATIAGVGLAAGIGLATGTSPLVVCALTGAALARWSPAHARIVDDLRATEPVAGAALWIAAGALVGGSLPVVAVAAVALALVPLIRRVAAPQAESDRTLGLAVVLSFTLTAASALGPQAPAVRTAASIALLLTAVVPVLFRPASRLTSRHPRPEVSV